MNNTRRNDKTAPAMGKPSSIIETKNQGIFVLGMHRSGTSACTRVLNLLGCALSDQLLGSGDGNEAGHWESIEALSLNEEMLASAGSSHDDWGPINTDWRESAIRGQMIQRASKILADHAELGPLFAIKDPRMCRLADVWLEAAVEAEVEPLVLLMLRNPDEVAASLEARDLMATGYAELLWLRYVLDAEFFTRGQKRVICRYDQLIGNWQSVIAKIKSGLSVSLPRNTPRVHAEISQFLSQSHRHHASASAVVIDDPSYSPWLRKAFQILLTWSEQGEDAADYPVLDGLRSELDRAYGTFARLLLTPQITGEVGSGTHLTRDLNELREETERKTEALRVAAETAEQARVAAAQRETELATRIDAEAAHAQSLQSAIELLNAELAASADRNADALRAELAERTAELVEVQSLLRQTHAEAGAERQRRDEAEERLAEASRELHRQQLRNAELAGQIAASQSALIQRQEELSQLLSQFHEAERVRLRAELECEQERERRLEWEQRMASADAEIGSLQALLDEARLAAEQRVDALSRDLAELTTLLKAQQDACQQAINQSEERAAEAQRLSEEVLRLGDAAGAADTARIVAERNLADRFNELAQLTAIVAEEAERGDVSENANQWLRDLRRLEESFPAWWAIMPRAWRQRRAHRRYYLARLFDAEAYRTLYPDVAAAAMDPVRHYILHGMAEGRTRPVPN